MEFKSKSDNSETLKHVNNPESFEEDQIAELEVGDHYYLPVLYLIF